MARRCRDRSAGDVPARHPRLPADRSHRRRGRRPGRGAPGGRQPAGVRAVRPGRVRPRVGGGRHGGGGRLAGGAPVRGARGIRWRPVRPGLRRAAPRPGGGCRNGRLPGGGAGAGPAAAARGPGGRAGRPGPRAARGGRRRGGRGRAECRHPRLPRPRARRGRRNSGRPVGGGDAPGRRRGDPLAAGGRARCRSSASRWRARSATSGTCWPFSATGRCVPRACGRRPGSGTAPRTATPRPGTASGWPSGSPGSTLVVREQTAHLGALLLHWDEMLATLREAIG